MLGRAKMGSQEPEVRIQEGTEEGVRREEVEGRRERARGCLLLAAPPAHWSV